MGFFQSCGHIGATVWLHHLDSKRLEKNWDRNYTRMLPAVLNKSSKYQQTKQQLNSHIPPILIKQTRHAGHCWSSKDELVSDILLWTLTHGHTSVGWPAKTYISSMWTLDAVERTCQEWWPIGVDGEQKSRDSLLSAWLEKLMIMTTICIYFT